MKTVRTGAKLSRLAAGVALACVSTVMTPGCAGPKEVERTPLERATSHLEVGNSALMDGDLPLAISHLIQAEKIDPTIPQIHHSKALAFYAKGDLETALASAREAVRLNPAFSEAQNTLGRVLMETERSDEAIAHLQKSAEDPTFREAYKPLTNLGILYYRQGDLAKSGRYLSRAVNEKVAGIGGGTCVAYYYLGHLRVKEGKLADAIDAYDRATRRACGNFADAHFALGIALERNRDYDKARRKFLEIQDQFPATPVASKALERLKGLP